MRLTFKQAAAVIGASWRGSADATFDGVSIDSRTLHHGDLFVAIRAERDGHGFAGAALGAGASGVIVDRASGWASDVVPTLTVEDTTVALQELGASVRNRYTGPVVGITGSTGKTSTKDLLRAILAQRGPIGASVASFNNEFGVPITLLNSPDDAWAVVVEMGARGPGHIAFLCGMARPNVAIVTNIGVAHLGEFQSVEAIAKAKGELVEAVGTLGPNGVVILNADDPSSPALRARTNGPVLTFGESPGADVRADNVELDIGLRPQFRLQTPVGSTTIRLRARGRHQVANALAASAGAISAGCTIENLAAGLQAAAMSPARMDLVRTASGALILNDAYNANPASMRAGLSALCELPARRRIAVLGVMAELGEQSASMHRLIATDASASGLIVVAVNAPEYGPGMIHVDTQDAAIERMGALGDGDAVLVKGSLVAGLRALAERMIALSGGAVDGGAATSW